MPRLFRLLLLPLLAAILTSHVNAQDEDSQPAKSVDAPAEAADAPTEPPKSDEPTAKEDEPAADPVAEWNQAVARRLEIFNELQALAKKFKATEGRDEKVQIRDEYDGLIREFEVSVYPKMLDLAADIYAENADDLNAAEIVMQKAFHEDRYEDSNAIAAKLLAADRRSRSIVRVAGFSQFALHNFEEATALLTEAKKNGWLDFYQSAYTDYAKDYIELWKAEQAIREAESALEGDEALPHVAFETERGKIVLELFEDQAPNTVANFVSLIEGGKYDGIAFHRVEPGFVIQGGDPNSLDDNPSNDGYGGPGYSIKCECYREDARMHFRGSLSMAHSGPDTGGSQFFITHKPTPSLNPQLDLEKKGHTVFGRVLAGMDVVAAIEKGDKITKAVVLQKRPHEYKPDVTPDTPAPADTPEADSDANSEEDASTPSENEPESGE